MAKEDNNPSLRRRMVICGIAAVLICLVTVFSIEWTLGRRTVGSELDSHIYSSSTFRLLSVSFDEDDPEEQLFLFNYDSRYNDSFKFEFDEDSDSYMILYTYEGRDVFLCSTADHELHLSVDDLGSSCRWNVDRIGSSMYYLIINEEDGLAICETDDCHVVMSAPDEEEPLMQMRLQ